MWVCLFWLHKNLVAVVFFLILFFFFPLQYLFLVRAFYNTGRFCLVQVLLHSYNDKEFSIRYGIQEWEEKEGRRKSVWVLFSATTERQFQVKSDIRKSKRGESTFLLCRVFKVLFIFKFYQQIFLLQCRKRSHVLLSSMRSFHILSKVLMYLKASLDLLNFLGNLHVHWGNERLFSISARTFFDRAFHVMLKARQVLISGFWWKKPEFLPGPFPSSLAASLAGWWEAIFCILWLVQSLVLQQHRQLELPGPLILGSMSGNFLQNPNSCLKWVKKK